MKGKIIYDKKGTPIGVRRSYEIVNDCSNGHDMEYSSVTGVIGGRCRRCGYKTT